MEEYISITKFANKANITRQAVYQRIDKDLSSFVKIIDNKKYISSSALSKFSSRKTTPNDEDCSHYQNLENAYISETFSDWDELEYDGFLPTNKPENDVILPANDLNQDIKTLLNDILDGQQKIIALIEEKDAQINMLQEENKIYKEKASQNEDALVKLLEQAQQLLIHNQLVLDNIFSVKNEKPSTSFEKLKDKIEQTKTKLFNS